MSDDDDDSAHDASLIPWELIGEFLTLPEILNTRLVSHDVIASIHGLSPHKCGALVEVALRARNVHLVTNGSWNDALQDGSSIGDMIIRDGHETTTSLDALLRCFRILQCLPMEVAVAFNAKYGRHCIPLKWNTETNQAEPQLYDACCKKKCRTCKFPIPADVTVDAKIHSLIQIQNKNGKPLDLKHFYNKCIPNLPSNLTCPSCRCTDKRTLVLSTYSYPSSAGGRNTLLTFTPRDVDDESSDESSSDTDNDDDDEQEDDYAVEPQRKKQRLDKEQNDDAASSFAFPPVYEDLALPTKWEPLERTPDVKHVIAIHCVSCQKFGMVAPAGPCCNDNFPCHERTRQVTIAARAATIGGVFMRRKCSNEACLHAVSCEACSRAVEHPMFDRDIVEASESGEASDDNDNGNEADDDDAGDSATDGNAMIVNHKTRCQTCNLRYCNECAWLSTICHHW